MKIQVTSATHRNSSIPTINPIADDTPITITLPKSVLEGICDHKGLGVLKPTINSAISFAQMNHTIHNERNSSEVAKPVYVRLVSIARDGKSEIIADHHHIGFSRTHDYYKLLVEEYQSFEHKDDARLKPFLADSKRVAVTISCWGSDNKWDLKE